ncbi:hypothetical protein [Flavobacterium urocaniciphilum]|uniref:BlaR1 peptidase M56 n=1 Tax=Flavobacterium urocaniciphilum TaxID=1299341 RepID=A0A1H9ATY0_9FLAO|nr:hypothetical protein [Flavobacterium urocaniciphilum]SEP80244.1 hypothetical protein SAMN05444005_102340 [Flavobacterium urocaniciphilum]
MIVIVFKYLTPKWVRGITLFPFIVLSEKIDKQDVVLLNHERIHLRQQLEMMVVPFFIVYIIEFLFGYIKFRNWQKAYKNISFEREAYTNEKDLYYLKQRSFWRFLKYY